MVPQIISHQNYNTNGAAYSEVLAISRFLRHFSKTLLNLGYFQNNGGILNQDDQIYLVVCLKSGNSNIIAD